MKKLFSITLCLTIIAMLLLPVSAKGANNAPSRMINVVYDDSGSMIKSGGQLVDTWCQAKYAMEVFAAMLGENDTMNVYYMSDYQYDLSAGPKLTLHGSDSQQVNIEKIHSTVSKAGNTPFNAVKKAYSDLQSTTADDKWLVVLTDGEFEDGRQTQKTTDDFFAAKQADIQVMFLAMGKEAGGITENKANHIFFEKAESNNQILKKITEICTRIFNSHRLEINVSAKTVEFDVPMGELVVFAQGANVSINGISSDAGKKYLSSSTPVTVQYSETAASNYFDFLIARNLKGSIASFKDDFPSGKYTIDVSGADTVEVYYKPNIEIAAYLIDASGSEVTSMKNLKRGEYTIQFGLVKAGTDEKVGASSLLGTVSYSATVENNGQAHAAPYHSGDRIVIEEGRLEIEAFAQYLEYNTVSTHLSYNVFEDKTVGFEIQENPEYLVSNAGVQFEKPIVLGMQVSGGISEEQWRSMGTPKVYFERDDSGIDDFRVEKGSEPGTFLLYPQINDAPNPERVYHNFEITVEYQGMVGEAEWSGSANPQVRMADKRTRIEGLQIVSVPEFTVTKQGLKEEEPIVVKAITSGEVLDDMFWNQMTLLETEVYETENGSLYAPFEVEKGTEPGEYYLHPRLKPGLMSYKLYVDYGFNVQYPGGNGTVACDHVTEGRVKVNDTRSWLERNLQLVIKVAIIAAIVIFILGYVPPFKKYLPRKLKSNPTIVCKPNSFGPTLNAKGKYRKNAASTIIPYRAERGTIKFVPSGAPGVTKMSVKAAGGNGMWITNTKSYAGKKNITFNGMSVPENQTKPIRISAAAMLCANTPEMRYTCIPNQ